MKLPPDHFLPPSESKPPARLGEKLMQQMGWQKGQGLGKEGTGRKEHIRVKKKDNTEGVRLPICLLVVYRTAILQCDGVQEHMTRALLQVGAGGSWNWGVKWWEQVFDGQAQALLQVMRLEDRVCCAYRRFSVLLHQSCRSRPLY